MYSLSKQEASAFFCVETLVSVVSACLSPFSKAGNGKWWCFSAICDFCARPEVVQLGWLTLARMQTVVQQNGSRVSWVASCAEVPAYGHTHNDRWKNISGTLCPVSWKGSSLTVCRKVSCVHQNFISHCRLFFFLFKTGGQNLVSWQCMWICPGLIGWSCASFSSKFEH